MRLEIDGRFLQQFDGMTREEALKFIEENYGSSRNEAVHMMGIAMGELPASDVGDITPFLIEPRNI